MIKVKLPALLGNYHRQTKTYQQTTEQPTDRPNERRTERVIGNLHFQ